MFEAFGRTFIHLDSEFQNHLRTLEFDNTISEYQFVDDLEDFTLVRFRLTPAETVRYLDAAWAFEEWAEAVEGGLATDAALSAVSNASVRRDVERYNWENPDNSNCYAAFMGSELEDLLCFHSGERRTIVDTSYERDRRRLIDEIIRALPSAIAHLSRTGRSGISALEFDHEEQVRDLLYVMLKGVLSDARIEDPTSKHAGTSKRIDITIPGVSTVVELKFARPSNAANIVDQLLVDIGTYHVHPVCQTLVCVVWDPTRAIKDRDAVVRDLSCARSVGNKHFVVKVHILS